MKFRILAIGLAAAAALAATGCGSVANNASALNPNGTAYSRNLRRDGGVIRRNNAGRTFARRSSLRNGLTNAMDTARDGASSLANNAGRAARTNDGHHNTTTRRTLRSRMGNSAITTRNRNTASDTNLNSRNTDGLHNNFNTNSRNAGLHNNFNTNSRNNFDGMNTSNRNYADGMHTNNRNFTNHDGRVQNNNDRLVRGNTARTGFQVEENYHGEWDIFTNNNRVNTAARNNNQNFTSRNYMADDQFALTGAVEGVPNSRIDGNHVNGNMNTNNNNINTAQRTPATPAPATNPATNVAVPARTQNTAAQSGTVRTARTNPSNVNTQAPAVTPAPTNNPA